MNDSEKKRFLLAMNWLAEKYPVGKAGEQVPRSLTKPWLADYFNAFRSLPIQQFEQGVKHHYATDAFFPDRPASLRKSCDAVPRPRDGWLPVPERVLLPEMTQEQALENRKRAAELLNGLSGSKFYVDGDGNMQAGGRRGKEEPVTEQQ